MTQESEQKSNSLSFRVFMNMAFPLGLGGFFPADICFFSVSITPDISLPWMHTPEPGC